MPTYTQISNIFGLSMLYLMPKEQKKADAAAAKQAKKEAEEKALADKKAKSEERAKATAEGEFSSSNEK